MLRDLKIPSQTLEAQLYCTQCAAVGMETSTTDETSTVVPAHYRTQAIFAMSNLSAACKPVLSSQFPPRYRKKNQLCQEAALSWSHVSRHCSARRAHRGPDHSTHILTSHPPVLKGNDRNLSRLQWAGLSRCFCK